MQELIKCYVLVICIGLLAACGEKAAVKVEGQDLEKQQTTDQSQLQDPPDQLSQSDLEQSTSGALIDAGYNLKVTSLLGIKVCDGEVNIEFNPMFSADGKVFDLPKAPVSCLFGMKKFDLGEMMGALGGPPPDPNGLPVSVEDDVIGLGQLGFAEFEPPRPMFPSFLATDIDDLKRIDVNRRIKMLDTQSGTRSSGTAHLKVTGFEKRYSPEGMDFEFKDVITFEVTHDGFDNIDKVSSFIFERMEMKVSLDPVAIPRIYLQARVRDMTGAIAGGADAGGADGGLLGGLLGGGTSGGLGTLAGELIKTAKVEMYLDMFRMEGLDDIDNDDEDDADEDDEGEDEDE